MTYILIHHTHTQTPIPISIPHTTEWNGIWNFTVPYIFCRTRLIVTREASTWSNKKAKLLFYFFFEWLNDYCVLTIFVTLIAKCANWVKQRSGGRQGRAGGCFSQAGITCNPGRFGPCRFGPAFKQDAVPGDNGEDEHSIGEGRRGTVFNFQGSLCHPFKLLNSEVSDWA